MIPAMYFLNHSTVEWIATLLLIPAGFAIFTPYSPLVFLGQSYLAKNVGFASGITLGLSASIGGLVAPFVGHMADTYGVGRALNILWISALVAAIFAFFISEPKRSL